MRLGARVGSPSVPRTERIDSEEVAAMEKGSTLMRQEPHTPWAEVSREFVVLRVWSDHAVTVETVDHGPMYWGILDSTGGWIEFYAGSAPREVRE